MKEAAGSSNALIRRRERLEDDLDRLDSTHRKLSEQLRKAEARLCELNGGEAEEECVKALTESYKSRITRLEEEASSLEKTVHRDEEALESLRGEAERLSSRWLGARLIGPDVSVLERRAEKTERRLEECRGELSRKLRELNETREEMRRESEGCAARLEREQKRYSRLVDDLRDARKKTLEDLDGVMKELEEAETALGSDGASMGDGPPGEGEDGYQAHPEDQTAPPQEKDIRDEQISNLIRKNVALTDQISKLKEEKAVTEAALKEAQNRISAYSPELIRDMEQLKQEVKELRSARANDADLAKRVQVLESSRIEHSSRPEESEMAQTLLIEFIARMLLDQDYEITPGYKKEVSKLVMNAVRGNPAASIYHILSFIRERLNHSPDKVKAKSAPQGEKKAAEGDSKSSGSTGVQNPAERGKAAPAAAGESGNEGGAHAQRDGDGAPEEGAFGGIDVDNVLNKAADAGKEVNAGSDKYYFVSAKKLPADYRNALMIKVQTKKPSKRLYLQSYRGDGFFYTSGIDPSDFIEKYIYIDDRGKLKNVSESELQEYLANEGGGGAPQSF